MSMKDSGWIVGAMANFDMALVTLSKIRFSPEYLEQTHLALLSAITSLSQCASDITAYTWREFGQVNE